MSGSEPSHELNSFPLLDEARELWRRGARQAAFEHYERALAARPNNVRGLVEFARALGHVYQIARAEELLAHADALAENDPRVAPLIAQSFRLIHRPRAAIAVLARLRQQGMIPSPLLGELALLYEQSNQVEAAHEAIAECVSRAPGQGEPQLVLARLERRRGNLAAAEELLLELTGREVSEPALAIQSWGELCQLRDQQGDFDGAVAAIEAAKGLQRRQPQAEQLSRQAMALNEVFRRLYAQIAPETLAAWRAVELPADQRCSGVAHLLGFPRSGTTLLEQVLDAHPGLVDSPERVVFSRDIFPAMYRPTGSERLSFDALKAIPRERLIAARRGYLDAMEAIHGEPLGGRVHLDKNPNHTSLIAGLFRLFPESRFLVALRDPRDVLVSAYLRVLPLTEFSAGLLTWGSTCLMYACDMNIWLRMRSFMEGNWLEVRYEDTVADLASQSRRTLSFLGLPWDEAVMDYRERTREKVVHSPSHDTVRQPVYATAIGRWRNYEHHLGPYLERLAPFVKVLGYE